jgi:hypothetical protein
LKEELQKRCRTLYDNAVKKKANFMKLPEMARCIESYLLFLYKRGDVNIKIIRNNYLFLSAYIPLMGVDNTGTIIKHFLETQKKDKAINLIQIDFLGGIDISIMSKLPHEKDIDIADIWGITYFDTMQLCRYDKKSWSIDDVKSFRKILKDDVEFDGYKASVRLRKRDNKIIKLSVKMSEGQVACFRIIHALEDAKKIKTILSRSKNKNTRGMIAEIEKYTKGELS